MAEPVPRPAVRLILLDGDGRILLQRFRTRRGQSLWITPGGGLDEGEDYEQAARRELREEIGLESFRLGPCVWVRENTFEWDGVHYRQRERYYLAETEPFEVDVSRQTAEEAEIVEEHRWWSAAEIERATDLVFVPRRLAYWLRRLESGPSPDPPVDVGV